MRKASNSSQAMRPRRPLFPRAYPREARMLVPVRKKHVQKSFQFRHDGMNSWKIGWPSISTYGI